MTDRSSSECLVEARQTLSAIQEVARAPFLRDEPSWATLNASGQLFNLLCQTLTILRRYEHGSVALTKEPIEFAPQYSQLARYVIEVCNGNLEPKDNTLQATNLNGHRACPVAEELFLHAAADLDKTRSVAQHFVYLNSDGEPVLFQKSHNRGEMTGLSLAPLNINGTVHIPGVLFSMKVPLAPPQAQSNILQVFTLDQETTPALSPIRPSIFALTPDEKQSCAKQLQVDHYSRVERPELLRAATVGRLDMITASVQKAVEATNVTV